MTTIAACHNCGWNTTTDLGAQAAEALLDDHHNTGTCTPAGRSTATVRPRHGTLTTPLGTTVDLRFEPTDDPTQFRATDAETGQPIDLRHDEHVTVDVLGPGQAVIFAANQW